MFLPLKDSNVYPRKLKELENRQDCITILITGDACGKTTMIDSCKARRIKHLLPKLTSFIPKDLNPNKLHRASSKPTGVDNYSCQINIHANSEVKPITLSLWDFGQYHSHVIQYEATARRANIIFACFDVTVKMTFRNLQRFWLQTLRDFGVKLPIILVGTKTDLRSNVPSADLVSREEVEKVVNSFGLECYVETSSDPSCNLIQKKKNFEFKFSKTSNQSTDGKGDYFSHKSCFLF